MPWLRPKPSPNFLSIPGGVKGRMTFSWSSLAPVYTIFVSGHVGLSLIPISWHDSPKFLQNPISQKDFRVQLTFLRTWATRARGHITKQTTLKDKRATFVFKNCLFHLLVGAAFKSRLCLNFTPLTLSSWGKLKNKINESKPNLPFLDIYKTI